jgi:hypothetical protein
MQRSLVKQKSRPQGALNQSRAGGGQGRAAQFLAALFSRFLHVEQFRPWGQQFEDEFRIRLFHLCAATASQIKHRFRRGLSHHFNFATTIWINTTVMLTHLHHHDAPSSDDNRTITVHSMVSMGMRAIILLRIATRARYIGIFRLILELSFQLIADGNAVAPGATGGEDGDRP